MSRAAATAAYPTITTVGALLPRDLIERLSAGSLDGMAPADYGLPEGFNLRQAAARAWELLLPTYRSFRPRVDDLPPSDPATVPTRDRWVHVLLRELGYDLTDVANLSVDGDVFDIRHRYGHVPVHILGWNVDLDRRAATNVRGASRTAPHSLVQELLNRSDAYLWALLTNGRRLRLLRDNVVLGRPAYTEFDLEAMFDGEQFADFAVMFALLHATRLRSDKPADCWLERWRTTAISEGTRALDNLRDGVTQALTILGTGFLQHPDNQRLRDLLAENHGATHDYYRWLLRLVYRLIFLFVAEDRDLLHPPQTPTDVRRWYADYFSTARLRRLAARRRGGRQIDLWASLRMVFDALGSDGQPLLGLPAYGSVLFDPASLGPLASATISNDHLLDAVRHLSRLPDPATGTIRAVDYRNLGAEELGSVYEALLEYVPTVAGDGSFRLTVQAGNARKTTGSYYTPTELVDLLLDETLDPLLDEAAGATDPVGALLGLTVCDPACGSGHFLVAAARRIARRVAIARTGDPEPTPDAAREAMREVVTHCIFGVDVNDLAAELAKIGLWLESLSPGRPLAFLDAHIKVGNALLGTTPALLAGNIPDDVYTPREGDDKGYAGTIRKRNRHERQARQRGQEALFGREILVGNDRLAATITAADQPAGTDIDSIRKQADAWRRAEADPELQRARLVADAWCAAFFWPLNGEAPDPVTHDTLIALQANPDAPQLREQRQMIDRLSRQHRFFHWHLEFPQIFHVPPSPAATGNGWTGGFAAVIGNPPWEKVKLADKEYFTKQGRPDIAEVGSKAQRSRLVDALADEDPAMHQDYLRSRRAAADGAHFLLRSGRYPLTGTGDVNLYAVFAETFRNLTGPSGQAGVFTPTGLATDYTTSRFFAEVFSRRNLRCFYDFVNGGRFFPGVDSRFRFAVSVFTSKPQDRVRLAFLLRDVRAVPDAAVHLSADDVLRVNPNTRTLPVFASQRDAEITLGVYRRFPVLIQKRGERRNPWGLSFMAMFDMSNDSGKFRDLADLRGLPADGWAVHDGSTRLLPLVEGKHVWLFDHRLVTSVDTAPDKPRKLTDAEHNDPAVEVVPRYYVTEPEVTKVLAGRWDRGWLLGFRDITNQDNERTFVAAAFPRTAVGNSLQLALLDTPAYGLLLHAVWSSLAFDYVARQKASGSHMNFYLVEQLACPPPEVFQRPASWDPRQTIADWLRPYTLELSYTSHQMRPYANELGDDGPPFTWDPDRRALLQAELDAAMLHVFGYQRAEAVHILNTFRVLRRREEATHGEYRTKRLVLDGYDRMAEAVAGGVAFRSRLDPPPGAGPRHREARQPIRRTLAGAGW